MAGSRRQDYTPGSNREEIRHMPVQAAARSLTDEQLRDVLRLSKGSDSVELKLTVPASGQRSAIRSLWARQ